MIRRPPRSTRTDTLFPYTTLFRSDRLEAAAGMAPGSVRIAVVATETPLAMFNLASYTPPHPRLAALTWGAEDLAAAIGATGRSEEHTSELQSLMRISYAVFCLKKKKHKRTQHNEELARRIYI